MALPTIGDSIPSVKVQKRRYAPWYNIPSSSPSIVSIEHPFIVQNIDKGIQTLGGLSALLKALEAGDNPAAKLYLKPGDRDCKPVISANVRTNDIVLRISVPKRTGLKRKRGSNDAYTKHDDLALGQPLRTATRLFRSLRDNEGKYDVGTFGRVEETHHFRNLPDFVFGSSNNSFMTHFRQTILPFDYPKMKNFQFDKSKGVKQNTDLIPPPRWDLQILPFNYNYRQNPNVKETVDLTGDPTLIVQGLPVKQLNQHTPCDAATIPMAPSPLLPDEATLDPSMQRIIAEARSLFASRPIWTRRALYNSLSQEDFRALGWNGAKHVQQYVGYNFDSGPWRDAIVRFGVDPRTDPECRIYQTMAFQLEPQPLENRGKGQSTLTKRDWKTVSELQQRKSHTFDGQQVHTDGKVWQICDVTDPLLSEIFASATLREKCHVKLDGWYQNGVFAKAKSIMKVKMRKILEGNPVDDSEFGYFATLPDILGPETRSQWAFDKNATKKGLATAEHVQMISDMRTTALRSQGSGGQVAVHIEDFEETGNEGSEDSGDLEEETDDP